MRRKNAWTTYNKKQLDELEKLCKNYLKFLDKGKTERECVNQSADCKAGRRKRLCESGRYHKG